MRRLGARAAPRRPRCCVDRGATSRLTLGYLRSRSRRDGPPCVLLRRDRRVVDREPDACHGPQRRGGRSSDSRPRTPVPRPGARGLRAADPGEAGERPGRVPRDDRECAVDGPRERVGPHDRERVGAPRGLRRGPGGRSREASPGGGVGPWGSAGALRSRRTLVPARGARWGPGLVPRVGRLRLCLPVRFDGLGRGNRSRPARPADAARGRPLQPRAGRSLRSPRARPSRRRAGGVPAALRRNRDRDRRFAAPVGRPNARRPRAFGRARGRGHAEPPPRPGDRGRALGDRRPAAGCRRDEELHRSPGARRDDDGAARRRRARRDRGRPPLGEARPVHGRRVRSRVDRGARGGAGSRRDRADRRDAGRIAPLEGGVLGFLRAQLGRSSPAGPRRARAPSPGPHPGRLRSRHRVEPGALGRHGERPAGRSLDPPALPVLVLLSRTLPCCCARNSSRRSCSSTPRAGIPACATWS